MRAAQTLARVAIATEECNSVTVSANTVTDYAGSGRPTLVSGIASWPAHGRLDVLDNLILVDAHGLAGPADDITHITPLRIDAAVNDRTWTDKNRATVTVKKKVSAATARSRASASASSGGTRSTTKPVTPAEEGPTVQPRAIKEFAMSAPLYDETPAAYVYVSDDRYRIIEGRVFKHAVGETATTTVRGNRIDTNGFRPAVVANVEGSLMFSDNQVRHAGVDEQLDVQPEWAVTGAADSLVVSANHVECAQGAMSFHVDARCAAVTGNVVTGQIEIDGAPLAAPWAGMNVQLP